MKIYIVTCLVQLSDRCSSVKMVYVGTNKKKADREYLQAIRSRLYPQCFLNVHTLEENT